MFLPCGPITFARLLSSAWRVRWFASDAFQYAQFGFGSSDPFHLFSSVHSFLISWWCHLVFGHHLAPFWLQFGSLFAKCSSMSAIYRRQFKIDFCGNSQTISDCFYMICCVKAELVRNSASTILQPFWPKFCKENSADSWDDILNAEFCRDFAQILPSDFCKYFGRNLRVRNFGCILRWTLRAEFRPKFLQNSACICWLKSLQNYECIFSAEISAELCMQNFGRHLTCGILADISTECCVQNFERNLPIILHVEFRTKSPQNPACRIHAKLSPGFYIHNFGRNLSRIVYAAEFCMQNFGRNLRRCRISAEISA